jgi:hypothetical protein
MRDLRDVMEHTKICITESYKEKREKIDIKEKIEI